MSHRTQITLQDEQYARLLSETERTGLGLAELVRRAVDVVYPTAHHLQIQLADIDASFGTWTEEDGEDRSAYLAGMRPGLGDR